MVAILGTEGNDNLVSPESVSNDSINGLAGDDRIEARGGDDLLIPGPGNDRLEGGDGRDTVLLGGNLDDYQIYRWEDEGVIRGPEGVDTLLDIEAIATDLNGTREFGDVGQFLGYAYLASYEDLGNAFGEDRDAAWSHFRDHGALEGRSILFDGNSYLAANTDVLANADFGANADEGGALHYLRFGRAEGRETDFDGLSYVASHGDLITAFGASGVANAIDGAGTEHYVQFGFNEGRQVDLFNETQYALLNPDLALAGVITNDQLAWHFVTYGYEEGRQGAYDPVIA